MLLAVLFVLGDAGGEGGPLALVVDEICGAVARGAALAGLAADTPDPDAALRAAGEARVSAGLRIVLDHFADIEVLISAMRSSTPP